MKQRILNAALALAIPGMLFLACKKGSTETDYNPALAVANNQVIAERAWSQLFNIFFMVVNDSTLKATGSNEVFGAQCTYNTVGGITYVIDYLPYYTPCPDGKVRKGVITASLDKDFGETGAVATLSLDDYVVDGLLLTGSSTVRNAGLSQTGNPLFEHFVPAGTITIYDTVSHGSFHWESEKAFMWVGGTETPGFHDDDIFVMSGFANGTSLYGAAFSATIDEPLGNYLNCRWIRTGTTLLSMPGLDVKNGYIDYIGEDSCTNLVRYYLNGNPFYERFERH